MWDAISPPEFSGVPLGFYGIMNLGAGQHFTGDFDGQGYAVSGMYQMLMSYQLDCLHLLLGLYYKRHSRFFQYYTKFQ
jgi:hypothetical protein